MEITLESASFVFSQDGNCIDGGHETLEVRYESSLGIDRDCGGFFVLKTDQWSVDGAEDLKALFDRITKINIEVEIPPSNVEEFLKLK
jgi:hypothetical protein